MSLSDHFTSQALVSEAYKLINTTQLTCSGAMALLAWPLLLSLWSSTLAKRPHIIFHAAGIEGGRFCGGGQDSSPKDGIHAEGSGFRLQCWSVTALGYDNPGAIALA